jgi:hypothetical protein
VGAAKVAGKAKAGLANLGNAIGGAGKRAGNKIKYSGMPLYFILLRYLLYNKHEER